MLQSQHAAKCVSDISLANIVMSVIPHHDMHVDFQNHLFCSSLNIIHLPLFVLIKLLGDLQPVPEAAAF